jgi:hypothetical protein
MAKHFAAKTGFYFPTAIVTFLQRLDENVQID